MSLPGRSVRLSSYDAAYKLIFPNPRNPELYVRLSGAASAVGMAALSRISDDAYDFGIIDSQTGEPIACGVFDVHWQCTDAGTLLGKDAIRMTPPGPRVP